MNKTPLYSALILIASAFSGTSIAESAGTKQAIEDYLTRDYYQIEFFVFERPEVMEFNTEEVLTLDRPRALPLQMRTQRLDLEQPWPSRIDPLTRACLTYPTLSFELLPPSDALLDMILEDAGIELSSQSSSSAVSDDTTEGADEDTEQALSENLPVPEIQPQLGAEPLLDLMAAMAAFERSLDAMSERWLESDSLVLSREAARVERTGLGRILFHGRWIEAVPTRDAPNPVLINSMTRLPLPLDQQELTGTIGVTLGRYLHFQAALYFHAPGLGLAPVSARLRADGTPVLDQPAPINDRYMVLSESRRMRSAETHYLDHPKLGLVVRIDPVEIPAELIEAFDRLKEDAE